LKIKNTALVNYRIFLIVVLMYFVPKYLEFTTFRDYDRVRAAIFILKNVSYICALIWYFVRLSPRKISIKLFFAVSLLILYFGYQAFFKDVNAIFVVFLFSLIFDDCFLDRYIKDIFICSSILYLSVVTSCKLGIIENVITDRNKFGEIWTAGGNGFEYSGQMIMMLIPVVFMYYYLRKDKISLFDNLFWAGITIFVFFKCKTIMGLALIVTFIASFNLFCKMIRNNFIVRSGFVTFFPVICCSLIFLLELLYRRGVSCMSSIDRLLNGRLSVTDRVIDRYGISLWGSFFENNTLDGKYEIVDSEYLYYALNAGVVYLLVSLVLCVLVIRYAQRKKDTYLTLIFLFVFINAIVNNGIWGIVMNPFSILLVPALKDFLVRRKKAVVCVRRKL